MYQVQFDQPVFVHFIGIGGISMSSLAEILLNAGFKVSGSDSKKSALTTALENKGVTVRYGQRAENITPDMDLVVYTSAIHPDNPEFVKMKELQIPSLTRAELLGQIMKNYKTPIAISGTHGKTTTTSMVSEILLQANTDPTLSIGGILKTIGGNYRIGNSEYFVTEACEYTNSFLSFFPKVSLILNIEEDHLDFFKDIHDIRASFRKFARLLPSDGTLIINGAIDHVEEITQDLSCKVLTFGPDDRFDFYPEKVQFNQTAGSDFICHGPQGLSLPVSLHVPGNHNVLNALASVALGYALHIPEECILAGLQNFSGTDRRFEYKGQIGGINVIDDYAHHPTEIAATLNAAANYPHKTLWCVFQPHTYTRTKVFMDDFATALSKADKVVLADIYAARETDTLGISSETLQKKISALGCDCTYLPSFDEIETFLLENCTTGDLLITMGAGDVHKIGENLLGL